MQTLAEIKKHLRKAAKLRRAEAARAAPDAGEAVAERVLETVAPPAGTRLSSGGVLSPAGDAIVFVAEDVSTSVTQLWVRRLDDPDAWDAPIAEELPPGSTERSAEERIADVWDCAKPWAR